MVTADALGNYVTAYASDLQDKALVGQELVVYGLYRRWEERAGVEIVSDPTGDYRLIPNPRMRVGSAGPEEKIFAGVVEAPGVLREIVAYGIEVLDSTPQCFAELVVQDVAQEKDWAKRCPGCGRYLEACEA